MAWLRAIQDFFKSLRKEPETYHNTNVNGPDRAYNAAEQREYKQMYDQASQASTTEAVEHFRNDLKGTLSGPFHGLDLASMDGIADGLAHNTYLPQKQVAASTGPDKTRTT